MANFVLVPPPRPSHALSGSVSCSLSCCAPEGVVPLFIYVSVELHTELMEIVREEDKEEDLKRQTKEEREGERLLSIKKLTKRRNTQVPIGHLAAAVAAVAARSCLYLPLSLYCCLSLSCQLDIGLSTP